MGWLGRLSLANDPEYAALKNDISTLKKQLKGSEDTTSPSQRSRHDWKHS
jgi:hypothetical protein